MPVLDDIVSAALGGAAGAELRASHRRPKDEAVRGGATFECESVHILSGRPTGGTGEERSFGAGARFASGLGYDDGAPST